MTNQSNGLKTVVKVFEVVEILNEEYEITPSELANRMDTTRSTAYDYLSTLDTIGIVINDGGSYRLGYRCLEHGGRLRYRNRFFKAGKVPLRKLAAETGEHCSLGVEEGGEWVLLYNDNELESFNLGSYSGMRTSIHTHAAGKVILSQLSDARVDEIIESRGLEPVTEHTITDDEKLKSELAKIESKGYAVDWNQETMGLGFVASPVVVDGILLGTVAIGCPTGRLKDKEYKNTLIQQVIATTDEIEVSYQYT
ncbi:IclR family transcriptional regulator [Halostagnicola bangensis]